MKVALSCFSHRELALTEFDESVQVEFINTLAESKLA